MTRRDIRNCKRVTLASYIEALQGVAATLDGVGVNVFVEIEALSLSRGVGVTLGNGKELAFFINEDVDKYADRATSLRKAWEFEKDETDGN